MPQLHALHPVLLSASLWPGNRVHKHGLATAHVDLPRQIQLNPSTELTYDILSGILTQAAQDFSYDMVHLGYVQRGLMLGAISNQKHTRRLSASKL